MMDKRVLLVVPNLLSGGSERAVSNLSAMFRRHCQTHVLLFDGDKLDYPVCGKIKDAHLPAGKSVFSKLWTVFRRARAIRQYVKQEQIDVLLSFTSSANIATALSGAPCKKYISARGYGYLKNHAGTYHFMVRRQCNILFNSLAMKAFYLEQYPQDEAHTETIYNLFDIQKIQADAESGMEANARAFYTQHRTIVTMSQFTPEKGQWHLIKAFCLLKKKIPDAGLVFVGYRGSLEKQIHAMADACGYAQDILFTGHQANPFPYLKNADVYALCSISEGFPNALIEAMATGIPVVATDCLTGPREIITGNRASSPVTSTFEKLDYGVLCPPFSKEVDYLPASFTQEHLAYAQALEEILTNSAIAEGYGARSLERAAMFDQSAMEARYLRLFEKDAANDQ